MKLCDKLNNTLANARFILRDDYVYIANLKAYEKNKGYGSKIIDLLKEKFKGKRITVNASWIDNKPPHKFYIDKGFIPNDKTAFEKLKIWIQNGSKLEEFPFPRCNSCCHMTLKP